MIPQISSLAILILANASVRPDERFDEDAQLSARVEEKSPRISSVRGSGYAFTGFDSNIELTSNEVPSTGVFRLGGDLEYARRLAWRWVGLARVSLDGRLWRTAATGGTLVTNTALSVGRFAVGDGRIRRIGSSSVFPRLRVLFNVRHQFGFNFAGRGREDSRPFARGPSVPIDPDGDGPEGSDGAEDSEGPEADNDEEAEELEEIEGSPVDEPGDGEGGIGTTAAFVDPFHRISAESQIRYDFGRDLRIELRPRILRAFINADRGGGNRNFVQVETRLRLTYDWTKYVSLRAGYAIEHRVHDERTNNFGDTLVYNTHRTEASVLLEFASLALRLRHLMRYRTINDPGRDRIRHGAELLAEYRISDRFSVIGEVAYMDEDRIGRPERDWNRWFTFAGLQIFY